ncbi:MAG: hypothetical protein KKA41_02625 [Proteobacteria bacterium]|nr:hypothetical protein [Pseudomonadota bacterium]
MKKTDFTCAEYRKEMILVQLRRKFSHADLSPDEKQALKKEIDQLEIELDIH